MKRALDIYIDGGRFAIAAKAEKDIAEIYEAEGNLTDVRNPSLVTFPVQNHCQPPSTFKSTAFF